MPLDAISRQRLITDWITIQHTEEGSKEREEAFWAFGEVWDMCCKNPDDAWDFIVGVLAQDSSDCELQNLSAGPLEDLLAKHGPNVIDRVEDEARRNPLFAKLLGGVWQNDMSADVWARVQAVWDRRGWDGNPEA
jgi:hypothetical protein